MLVIEGAVIRRMGLEERDKKQERIAAMLRKEIAYVCFKKLRLGKLEGKLALKLVAEIALLVVWAQTFGDEKFLVITDGLRIATDSESRVMTIEDGNPLFEPVLRKDLVTEVPLSHVSGAVV